LKSAVSDIQEQESIGARGIEGQYVLGNLTNENPIVLGRSLSDLVEDAFELAHDPSANHRSSRTGKIEERVIVTALQAKSILYLPAATTMHVWALERAVKIDCWQSAQIGHFGSREKDRLARGDPGQLIGLITDVSGP
jgi:hypothetical protein